MHGVLLAAALAFGAPDDVSLTPIAVEVQDGTTIHALEYRRRPENHRATLIITGDGTDGAHSDTVDALAETMFLRGFDVVTWDRRGTGRSTGRYDFGYSDESDLIAVTRAIGKRTFDASIGLIGIGVGGAASLRAGARMPRVQAIATYGVGAGGVPVNDGYLARMRREPDSLIGGIVLRLEGVRAAAPPAMHAEADLTGAVTKLAGRAVFISIGRGDKRVGVADAKELYEAARPPKEWGLSPSGDESPPIAQWARQLEQFFSRQLR